MKCLWWPFTMGRRIYHTFNFCLPIKIAYTEDVFVRTLFCIRVGGPCLSFITQLSNLVVCLVTVLYGTFRKSISDSGHISIPVYHRRSRYIQFIFRVIQFRVVVWVVYHDYNMACITEKCHAEIHVSKEEFSNDATNCLTAVLPDNQIPDWEILYI